MDRLEILKEELRATESKLEELQNKIKELESPIDLRFGAILVNDEGHMRIYPFDSEHVSLFSNGKVICTGSKPVNRINEYKEVGYKQLTKAQVREVVRFAASFYNES